MATTGFTFKGKFYPYGSELPQELKDVLKARGLNEMGQPLKPEPTPPPTDQHPLDQVQTGQVVEAETEARPAAAKSKTAGKGK